jgi:hypothetical protein
LDFTRDGAEGALDTVVRDPEGFKETAYYKKIDKIIDGSWKRERLEEILDQMIVDTRNVFLRNKHLDIDGASQSVLGLCSCRILLFHGDLPITPTVQLRPHHSREAFIEYFHQDCEADDKNKILIGTYSLLSQISSTAPPTQPFSILTGRRGGHWRLHFAANIQENSCLLSFAIYSIRMQHHAWMNG